MERRSFLKGLFAAGGTAILAYPHKKIDEATALVQMATPEEMALLRQEENLKLKHDKLTTADRIEALYKAVSDGGELYAQVEPGQFLSVGWIRSAQLNSSVNSWVTVDVTTFGADFEQYVPGFVGRKKEIYFELVP